VSEAGVSVRSAFGFDVRGRARVARATDQEAAVVVDEDAAGELTDTLQRIASAAASGSGAADAAAVAHPDDLDEAGLEAWRSTLDAAGLDALLVPESIARAYAPDIEGDAQVAVGAARYALGREDRGGALGGIAGGGVAGGVAAGTVAGAASRAGSDPAGATMADFGEGRDMSQFGEGSQMSDFGEGRDMSEFGEGRDMSEFGRQQQQATPPPAPTAASAPPPPPPKSKAKLAIAAAVVVAVIAVVAVVALASGGGNDDTAVTTGGSDSTTVEENDEEAAAGEDKGEEEPQPSGPSAGGPIAFNASDGTSSQIFVTSPDGSDLRQVTQFGEGGTPGFHFTEVEWAPDGKTIYFTGNRADDESGAPALWAVDPDGSNVRELGAAGKPIFSIDVGADGRIVALRGQVPAERALVVLDADGGSEQPVTQGQIDLDPTWTPDGAIVFVRASAEGSGLFRVNADGSGLQQLVPTFGFTAAPDVSPDGERITWISSVSAEDRTPALWVANADGSEARFIEGFEGGGFESAGTPRWSKNSDFLLMTDSNGQVVLIDAETGKPTPLFSERPPHSFLRYDILTAGVDAFG
jgi:Tol biopolymer transport system component